MKWRQKGILVCGVLFVLLLAAMLVTSFWDKKDATPVTYASEDDVDMPVGSADPNGENVSGAAAEAAQEQAADAVTVETKNENQKEADPKPSDSTAVTPASGKKKTTDQATAGEKKNAPKTTAKATPLAKVTSSPSATTEKWSVYVEIQCRKIMDQRELWKEGIEEIIPSSGVFYAGTCTFSKGETAYDVLRRICKEKDIALDSSYTPLYGSYYIKGIGNLYEFDCGSESGWKYAVNDVTPSVGTSRYTLQNKDRVIFYYDYTW